MPTKSEVLAYLNSVHKTQRTGRIPLTILKIGWVVKDLLPYTAVSLLTWKMLSIYTKNC